MIAVLAAAELENAGQLKHVITAEAPVVVEYLPATQSMHEAAPVTALNFPAPHATHVPPFGPVWPALH